VALIFALGACVKMDARLSLDGDTVSGSMIVGLDKQVAAQSGQSQEKLLEDMTKDVPAGAKVDPYSDDRFIGVKATLDKVPLVEFNGDSDGDDIRIVRDKEAGTYTVSGVFDLTELTAQTRPDVRVAINFPGTVTRHNGQLDGTTVTWVGRPGERLTIEAVAEDGASGLSTLLLALAIGVPLLLVLGGVVLWLVLRGRKRPAPVGAYPYPPPGGAPPPSPAP
jgi:hypothetical protein